MKCAVIIVAAGRGTRFKSTTPKALVLLAKKPLIVHSLTVFERCISIGSIVIVGQAGQMHRFKALAQKFKKVASVVTGGKTRADSVKCGLAVVEAAYDYVLVHDAARPLIDDAMLRRVIGALLKSPAVITAVPVKATIKEINTSAMTVNKTLPRALLWEVQTPQGFNRAVLTKAHEQKFQGEATDDAMLVEHLGVPVKIVMGNYRNIKVTTPEDLQIAAALL